MKAKTYNNFLRVMRILEEEKHYTRSESEQLAHLVFDNVERDRKRGDRSAEYFARSILSKEDYAAQYNAE